MRLSHYVRLVLCAYGLVAAPIVRAADNPAPPPSAPPSFSAAEMEALAAPIALHPDPLIAILLPASVYPLEIVQAARFVKDTNNISKVAGQPWDENVKTLAGYPDLIQMMDADLMWTMNLGQAVVNQQKELMGSIQVLRAKANSAGVLKTSPQQVVVVTNTIIEKTVEQRVVFVTNTVVQIQPSNPQIVYVPVYPPTIYYPPPVPVGPPPVVTFAAGVVIGAIIADNNSCDWHSGAIYVSPHGAVVAGSGGYHSQGDVNVNVSQNVHVEHNSVNYGGPPPQKWQPDPDRMHTAGAAGARPSTLPAESRGWGSGAATPQPAPSAPRPAQLPAADRPSTAPGQSYNRPPAASSGEHPSQLPAADRPSTAPGQSYNQPPSSPSTSHPAPNTSGGSAFSGVNSGASTQQSSSRGSSSRGTTSSGGKGHSSGGGRR